MIKQEALKYLKEKSKEGYLTYPFIIQELYKDNEKIPQHIIDCACFIPEPPKPQFIVMGTESYKKWNEIFKDYAKTLK